MTPTDRRISRAALALWPLNNPSVSEIEALLRRHLVPVKREVRQDKAYETILALHQRGYSLRRWSREHGYTVSTVSRAINGVRAGCKSDIILREITKQLIKPTGETK